MAENISTLTDATFDEEVKASTEPVLVDFWAAWCGPCLKVAPILEEIANEKAGSLRIAKLNIDEYPDLQRRFEIQSIPTMILFKNGEPAHRFIGAMRKPELLAELTPHIS